MRQKWRQTYSFRNFDTTVVIVALDILTEILFQVEIIRENFPVCLFYFIDVSTFDE